MTATPPRRRAAALRYAPPNDAAPVLLARGDGHVAERILEIAREQGIPIHENAAIVDVLSRVELEREIPPELYRVVAEIIAFVFRVQAAATSTLGSASSIQTAAHPGPAGREPGAPAPGQRRP